MPKGIPKKSKTPAGIDSPIKLEILAAYWKKIGLQMDSRRYRQIVDEGLADRPVNGWLNAVKAPIQIAIYYQRMAKGKGDTTHEEEKKLKTREERMIKAMERKTMEGSLIDKNAVANELVKRTHMIKSDMLSCEKRIVRWADALDIIRKAHRHMMRTYARKGGVFSD